MNQVARPELLVYYFGFPHYRKAILEQLLSRTDVDVKVVSGSTERESIETLTSDNLPGLRVLPSITLGPFTWDRGIAWSAVFGNGNPVIVGPALSSLTTWMILIGRRVLGRPTFLWGQCGRLGDRSLRRRAQEIMNRLATGLLVYGRGEEKAATELGTNPRKVHVVNNATSSNADAWTRSSSLAAFDRLQESARSAREHGRLHLTFIGRLTPDKKLEVLVDAARQLSSTYPGLRVDVVGDGPMRADLEAMASNLPVVFHGWVYDVEERDSILQDTTLVVSPFHMGLVAVDSLRFGVPVLVPDNPMCGSEVEALTPYVTALRFAAGQPGDIARAASEWVSDAISIDVDQFSEVRERELRRWDPVGVSEAIISATRGPARHRDENGMRP